MFDRHPVFVVGVDLCVNSNHPSGHAVRIPVETLTQWWVNVGPTSMTAAQHYPNIRSTSRVVWS